jgi:hypothetical protein
VGTIWKTGRNRLLCWEVVDVSQNNDCAERYFMLFAFQLLQPVR